MKDIYLNNIYLKNIYLKNIYPKNIYLKNIYSRYIQFHSMTYRVCRPQVLQRNGQFHFFLQIFARMPARSRENLQEKMKLTISLPQGPLKEPFIYIFNQNLFILLIYKLKINYFSNQKL